MLARDLGERDAAQRGGANDPREPFGPHAHSDDRGLMHVDVPSPGASLPVRVRVPQGYPPSGRSDGSCRAPALTHGVDYCMHSVFVEHIRREHVN